MALTASYLATGLESMAIRIGCPSTPSSRMRLKTSSLFCIIKQRRMLSSPARFLGTSGMIFSCCHQTPRRYPHSLTQQQGERLRDHTTYKSVFTSTKVAVWVEYKETELQKEWGRDRETTLQLVITCNLHVQVHTGHTRVIYLCITGCVRGV